MLVEAFSQDVFLSRLIAQGAVVQGFEHIVEAFSQDVFRYSRLVAKFLLIFKAFSQDVL